MKYFWHNFTKKLFLFAIVIFLSGIKIGFFEILIPFIFTFFYLPVYYFNDYIDREYDKKDKRIPKYKLELPKEELLKRGLAIFFASSLIILFLSKILLLVYFSIISLGVIRSFVRKRLFRGILLHALQVLQFLFLFLWISSYREFLENFAVINAYSSLYTLCWLFLKKGKISFGKNELFFAILFLLFLLLSIGRLRDIFLSLSIGIILIAIIFSLLFFLVDKKYSLLKNRPILSLVITTIVVIIISLSLMYQNFDIKKFRSDLEEIKVKSKVIVSWFESFRISRE